MDNILRKLTDGIEIFLDYTTFTIFCVMVVSIVIQVFSRYVLNSPTAWSEELARFLMVAITMFGSAAVIRREGHIAVTVLLDRIHGPLYYLLTLFRDILILFMAGALTYYGIGLALVAKRQVSTGMEIPMYIPYAAIPAGSFFIAIMLLLTRLVDKASVLKGDEE